ncbi:uncharacterized protein [Antennarius striatus]|uniref:uncharacterized protein isoform X4 n=1 Tax=Antennarius striatus TaxID=241820 RepID=UPI0035B264AD
MLNRWSFHIMMQTKEGSGRGGGDKTAMDLRTVMIISTLLLKTTESVETTFRPDVSETYAHVQTNNNRTGSNTPTSVSAKATPPRSLVLELGLLTVVWTSECEGDVKLILHHLVSSPLPVCHGSVANVQSLLRLVCQSKKGCTGTPQWDKSRNKLNGYWFSESGAVGTNCETLRVQCTGLLPDSSKLSIPLPTFSLSVLWTCPNHLSLASLTLFPKPLTCAVPLMYSFLILSILVTPKENLSIFISATSR